MNYGIPYKMAEEVWLELRRQGITLTKLEELTGIPRQRLSRKLNGRKPIHTDELGAIIEVIGIPLSELARRAEAA